MKELIEYIPFLFLAWLARRLSFRSAGRLGAALGTLAYALPLNRKDVALDNLSKAFPELPASEVERIARGAFRNYGTALMEFLWSDGQPEDELLKTIRVPNTSAIEKYLSGHRGMLLLSAHYGGWEFTLQSVRLYMGRPTVAIVHPLRNKKVDRIVQRIRSQFGNSMIPMSVSVRKVLEALKEGRYITLLGDQSGPKESIFIEFFRRPAATHRGAAAFSLKTDAPIVMVFLMRQKDGTYEVAFEEVDRSGLLGYTEENVIELTRRHTAILEQYIRKRPDHWLWMHKRWKHPELYQTAPQAEDNA